MSHSEITYADGKTVQVRPEDARAMWQWVVLAHKGNPEGMHQLRKELAALAPEWRAP